MDVHVECLNKDHYRRWLEEEGWDHGPVSTNATSTDTNSSIADSVIRGQSPAEPRAADVWWTRPAANPVQRAPASNPYATLRGQDPASQPQSAYATLPSHANSPYGGTLVAPTSPANKPPTSAVQPAGYQQAAYQGAPTSGTPYQQAQYTESIAPPAQGFGPTPGFSANPVPGYQVYPNGDLGFPGQPYPEKSVDVVFEGQETQTGRLQMGVGVNSDAGLIGNIVVDERHFDWRRWPRSFEDVRNGTAFRGAGQHFRIDASPGSQVHRYMVSFQEPYLWDSPISFGLSGSYFTRRFNDWDEDRLGGRVSFGYQWLDRDLSAVASYRGESVDISNTSTAVGDFADLDEVRGGNALHGLRLALINDTRDSTFLATQGHYLELSGEQVIGSFSYPRLEVDFRKYFLLSERPDHSGRHVLS
jgi:outer membrane protein insertion porin family